MNAHLTRARLLAIALVSFVTWPVSAGGLYRFVDANGAIVFTDVPPPSDGARVVEQIPIGETTNVAKPVGMPHYSDAEVDGAMAQANARIDLAEHNLAIARQGLSFPRDLSSLPAGRTAPVDWSRVEFYKNGVLIARQQLMDLLRARQATPVLAAR